MFISLRGAYLYATPPRVLARLYESRCRVIAVTMVSASVDAPGSASVSGRFKFLVKGF